MHILFLTDNFPPEVNAPASRTFEHCRQWAASGIGVTVITGAPNFPKGQVYDGYRNRLWQVETMNGIRVIRVWTYITANEGFLRRVLDYLSFMVAAVICGACVRRIDVVVGTSPQFFTACAAWAVSHIKRVPWVFELRDFWPESIKTVGAMKDSIVLRLLERIEHYLYRSADAIVAVTHSFKDALMSRGIDRRKIHVVTNGVDISSFSAREKDVALTRELGLEGCFVAGYIGTHGLAHGLETLIEAARILQQNPDARNVRFLFLGDGARKASLMSSARESGLTNVMFIDSVPKSEVPRYWSILDVSVIHLRKAELFESVIPSKLFECMGMGIPVLHGVPGESAAIVRQENVGAVFESENSLQLAQTLLELRDHPDRYAGYKRNGPVAARNYDRTVLARSMAEVLQRLVDR